VYSFEMRGCGAIFQMEPSREYTEPGKVVSPFANTEAVLPSKKRGGGKMPMLVVLAVILVAAGAGTGVYLTRYLNDPLRTLENFPVAKYLDGYRGLAGSKFKGQMRVEADLGWKEGIGRLMLFTCPDDNRPVAVMIPAAVAGGIYFTKGQTYMAELEVKEGGLIYANSCKKN
jgi:hypothetical protein